MTSNSPQNHAAGLRTRWTIAFCAFALIAAFFLLTGHLAHVLGLLPWLLFLACPLMHVFMHHGTTQGSAGPKAS